MAVQTLNRPAPKAAPANGKTDAAKKAEREANQRKRREKLAKFKTTDENRWRLALNEKEAQEVGLAADWPTFCGMKKTASIAYWDKMVSAGKTTSEKGRQRKLDQFAKMKAMYAKLEAQLKGLGVDPASVIARQPEPKPAQ